MGNSCHKLCGEDETPLTSDGPTRQFMELSGKKAYDDSES